jgi:hypothetical protein
VEQVEVNMKQGLVSAVARVRLVLPPSGSCWRGLLPSAVVCRSLCRAHCPHCHLVWQIVPPPPHALARPQMSFLWKPPVRLRSAGLVGLAHIEPRIVRSSALPVPYTVSTLDCVFDPGCDAVLLSCMIVTVPSVSPFLPL